MVVEFLAVVSLQTQNRMTKLSANVCMKANDGGQDIRLVA